MSPLASTAGHSACRSAHHGSADHKAGGGCLQWLQLRTALRDLVGKLDGVVRQVGLLLVDRGVLRLERLHMRTALQQPACERHKRAGAAERPAAERARRRRDASLNSVRRTCCRRHRTEVAVEVLPAWTSTRPCWPEGTRSAAHRGVGLPPAGRRAPTQHRRTHCLPHPPPHPRRRRTQRTRRGPHSGSERFVACGAALKHARSPKWPFSMGNLFLEPAS